MTRNLSAHLTGSWLYPDRRKSKVGLPDLRAMAERSGTCIRLKSRYKHLYYLYDRMTVGEIVSTAATC